MIDPESLKREKILFSYTSALERGDFARLAEILEKASSDAILERQIIEINTAMSQALAASVTQADIGITNMTLWQRLKSITSVLFSSSNKPWPLVRSLATGLIVVTVVVLAGLAILRPAIRNIFQNIVNAAPTSPYPYYYSQAPDQGQPYPAQPPQGLVVKQTQMVAATQAPASQVPGPAVAPTAVVATQSSQLQTNPYNAYPAPGSQQPTDRLIVRNGSLTVVAKDTRQARQAVMAMVAEFATEGAFVVSSNETFPYGDQMPVISMVLRVPVKRYDESMTRLAGLGIQVLSRQENSQDVTQDYVDVSARIEALEASRTRLLEIIKEAKNTDDLLRAEQALSQRESELEAAKARQQYLEQTAALSSIALELRPAVTSQPVNDNIWNPANTFYNAVRALLATLRGLVDGIIFFAVTILPWLVVVGLLVYGLARLILAKVKK